MLSGLQLFTASCGQSQVYMYMYVHVCASATHEHMHYTVCLGRIALLCINRLSRFRPPGELSITTKPCAHCMSYSQPSPLWIVAVDSSQSGSSELRSWLVSPSPSPSPLPCWPAGDEPCALAKQPVCIVCVYIVQNAHS